MSTRTTASENEYTHKSRAFTVPLVPPSVNHYKTRFRNGNTVVSGEALAFKDAVSIFSRQEYVVGKKFAVAIKIVLGKGDKGDVDNFPKLVLDGLAAYGAFQSPKGKVLSDAHVCRLEVSVDREQRPEQGSTWIGIEALQ
jgi:Holliday junction resolvase RusA-like endonuclease